jgi:hypothetical protein
MIYESISVLSRINHGPFTSQLRILLQPIYTLYISRDFNQTTDDCIIVAQGRRTNPIY